MTVFTVVDDVEAEVVLAGDDLVDGGLESPEEFLAGGVAGLETTVSLQQFRRAGQ